MTSPRKLNEQKAVWYSVASGLCAALGSALTKLAVANNRQNPLCLWIAGRPCDDELATDATFVTLRILCFGLQTLSGIFMWWLFSRALRESPSSVYVSVINTACNFMLTALFGSLLFGEHLSTRWSMGASLMLFGTVLVHHGTTHAQRKLATKKSS